MENLTLSLTRALRLLEAVIADGGRSSLSDIARSLGVPVATAHRHVATLVDAGWLMPTHYGRHMAGPALRRTGAIQNDIDLMTHMAEPILLGLAKSLKSVVQLGTLDHDMVTYRVKTGRDAEALFTQIGAQLEAYCSGMGKALLAHLPDAAREAYLGTGPFIALTKHTVTDPGQLRAELNDVRRQGYAEDREEVAEGLRCLAVPLRNSAGEVAAAISASRAAQNPWPKGDASVIAALQEAAWAIEARLQLSGLQYDMQF